MPSDFPKNILKITAALLKHQATLWLGEEAVGIAGEKLIEIGGEKLQENLDQFITTESGSKELLKAIENADRYFQQECRKADLDALCGAFSLSFGNLPGVQHALKELPQAMDSEGLKESIENALQRDLGKQLSAEQIKAGANLYADALLRAIKNLKEFTLPVISQTVFENQNLLLRVIQNQEKMLALLDHFESFRDITQARKEARPGQLPFGSYFPLESNPIFTGRAAYLEKLEKAFFDEQTSEVSMLTQAISGMGGIGKTQLAVEFAYRFGYRFRGVHWISATGVRSFEDLLPAIALSGSLMNLAGFSKQDIAGQVQMTLRAWQAEGPRLIIVDNLEDADAAAKVLPPLRSGENRLLATSRYRDWVKTMPIRAIPLEEFSTEESLAFLRKHLDKNRASDKILNALAEKVGHLPLALELAGTYLSRLAHKSVENYIDALSLTHSSLRNWWQGKNMPSPTAHEKHVANTFALSWEVIEAEKAQNLYKLAGYFAPNLSLPKQSLYEAGEFESEDAFEENLLELRNYALLKEDNSLHPLLAEFARSLDAENQFLAIWARTFAAQCYGKNGVQYIPLLYQHAQHALPELLQATELEENQEEGWFYVHAAWLLKYFGRLGTGLNLYKRALVIFEEIGDKAGEGTTLNNISQIFKAQGDYATALDYLKKSLAIQEEIGDKAGLCVTLFNMGHIHWTNNEQKEAMEKWLTSYKIAKAINYAQVLQALVNLAPQLGMAEGLEGWEGLLKSDE